MSAEALAPATATPSLIVYDGECIFCQNYVKLFRLRETVGPIELLDARSDDPRIADYWRQGFDLNQGMLFVHQGRVFHGADAVTILAQLSTNSGWFNRLNRFALSNSRSSALLYPLLKLGRRATLFVRGRHLLERVGGA